MKLRVITNVLFLVFISIIALQTDILKAERLYPELSKTVSVVHAALLQGTSQTSIA